MRRYGELVERESTGVRYSEELESGRETTGVRYSGVEEDN